MCIWDISASSKVFGNFIIIEWFLDSTNSGFCNETTKRVSLPKPTGMILAINIKVLSTEKHRVSVV